MIVGCAGGTVVPVFDSDGRYKIISKIAAIPMKVTPINK